MYDKSAGNYSKDPRGGWFKRWRDSSRQAEEQPKKPQEPSPKPEDTAHSTHEDATTQDGDDLMVQLRDSFVGQAVLLTKDNWYYITAAFFVFFTLLVTLSPHDLTMMSGIIHRLVEAYFSAVFVNYCLQLVDGKAFSIQSLLVPFPIYMSYLFCGLFVVVAMCAGLLLLIFPGIYFLMRLVFAPILVIDRKLSIMDALIASEAATKGHCWRIFGSMMLIWLFSVSGILLLGLGLFYTIPISYVALVILYRRYFPAEK